MRTPCGRHTGTIICDHPSAYTEVCKAINCLEHINQSFSFVDLPHLLTLRFNSTKRAKEPGPLNILICNCMASTIPHSIILAFTLPLMDLVLEPRSPSRLRLLPTIIQRSSHSSLSIRAESVSAFSILRANQRLSMLSALLAAVVSMGSLVDHHLMHIRILPSSVTVVLCRLLSPSPGSALLSPQHGQSPFRTFACLQPSRVTCRN